MKNIKKITFEKLLIIYILIQPILDAVTSVCVRNISAHLTVGVFVRSLCMGVLVIYSLIVANKKWKKISIIHYGMIFAYIIIYILMAYKNTGLTMIITELKGLIKTFYLPICLTALLSINSSSKIKIDIKYLIFTLNIYCAVIILSKILGIGYSSYMTGKNVGTIGLFYAANEIGAIISILSTFLFIKMCDLKVNKLYYISYFMLVYTVLEIGTKVPFFAFIVSLIIYILIMLYSLIIYRNKGYAKKLIIPILTIIAIIFSIQYTAVGKNLEYKFINISTIRQEQSTEEDTNKTTNKDTNKKNKTNKQNSDNINIEEADVMLSSRITVLNNNREKFMESQELEKLFGNRYLIKTSDNIVKEKKIVEMDFFDIIFNHGIIGTIIILTILGITVIYIIICAIRNLKKVLKENIEEILYVYTWVIGLGVAFVTGHVLSAPAVSIFIIISIIVNINQYKYKGLINEGDKKNEDINNNANIQ